MGYVMRLQMKLRRKVTFMLVGLLVLLALGVVAYFVTTHQPGLTVFIENADRRALLKQCLIDAGVQFEETEKGGFRARSGSVQKMQVIWAQFDDYRTPSLGFCSAKRQVDSKY
jgi:hypothetical protein